MAATVRIARLALDLPSVQYARPSLDVSGGGWAPSSGVDLAPMLDETTPNDTDLIASSADPSDTCEIRLQGANRPLSGTCYLRLRLKRDA